MGISGLFIILIAIAVGLIFLQNKLCKSPNGRKIGLILPLISLIFSLLIVIEVSSKSSYEKTVMGTDEFGKSYIISSQKQHTDLDLGSIIGIGIMFNLPTLIFLGEYFTLRPQKEKSVIGNTELDKTKIQDL